LPFVFEYDFYEYDKIQMSTNGWLEFGIGSNGTERGLSTPDQLGPVGANENGRLASTSRPNKALGPWWEDLNADGNGRVRYTTIGTAPDRVFICQWENMRAYWDPSTTTARVNFQIRLYEDSNKIEFCYGHVQVGTFGGTDIGAAIGFKDHIGGDYHFYDISAGGAIPAGDVITDLNPLTNWPGEGTVYEITTSISGVNDPDGSIPERFALYQNYPNPFNPSTKIKFSLPKHSKVSLVIYDLLGRKVTTIVNRAYNPGTHIVEFNTSNHNLQLSSGVYIYQLVTEDFVDGKKLMLLK
jgi:hypothetical protein